MRKYRFLATLPFLAVAAAVQAQSDTATLTVVFDKDDDDNSCAIELELNAVTIEQSDDAATYPAGTLTIDRDGALLCQVRMESANGYTLAGASDSDADTDSSGEIPYRLIGERSGNTVLDSGRESPGPKETYRPTAYNADGEVEVELTISTGPVDSADDGVSDTVTFTVCEDFCPAPA